jgi:hypothetical protein
MRGVCRDAQLGSGVHRSRCLGTAVYPTAKLRQRCHDGDFFDLQFFRLSNLRLEKQTLLRKAFFLRRLPLYHLSVGAGLLGRTLLFSVLQAFGVYYILNITLGILVSAAINYNISTRYVFNDSECQEIT